MGRVVIVAYKPKAGKSRELEAAVPKHCRVLREEALITDRQPVVMMAVDGTIIEVFEWRSAEAIAAAHVNPRVGALWSAFGAACDYVPLATVAEAKQLFAEFAAIEP